MITTKPEYQILEIDSNQSNDWVESYFCLIEYKGKRIWSSELVTPRREDPYFRNTHTYSLDYIPTHVDLDTDTWLALT